MVIALKAKRANVYTSNAVDAVTSTKDGNYVKKTIPKTNEQAQFISKSNGGGLNTITNLLIISFPTLHTNNCKALL